MATATATVKMIPQDEKKGKKLHQVATMIEYLKERHDEDPVPFEALCDHAGAKYPQDVQAAMFALELTGLVDRYSYVTKTSTRAQVAYKWSGEVAGGVPPTKARGAKNG